MYHYRFSQCLCCALISFTARASGNEGLTDTLTPLPASLDGSCAVLAISSLRMGSLSLMWFRHMFVSKKARYSDMRPYCSIVLIAWVIVLFVLVNKA